MNERKLALSYLDLNPELRNNLGIIAEEMYRIIARHDREELYEDILTIDEDKQQQRHQE